LEKRFFFRADQAVQGFAFVVLLVNDLRQHTSADDQERAQDNKDKDSAGTVH
jgi:hypothetical protein